MYVATEQSDRLLVAIAKTIEATQSKLKLTFIDTTI